MITPDRRDPVVFLGPSLPVSEAASLLRAEFRPPIRRGDLEEIAGDRVVLIIDGEFDQNLPVSPKEILRVLDAGATVVGAASMGALRAAELAPHGMIGVGRIFEAYRSGQIEGDDEVAVSYCPWSFEPRTVPLVHVRFWLDDLVAANLLGPIERSLIYRRARRVFYADRTPDKLTRIVDDHLGIDRSRSICEANRRQIPDSKAADARAAMVAVARLADRSPSLD